MRTPSNSPNHAHTFVRLDLQRLRTSGLRIDGGGMATCSTTRARSSTIPPVSKVSTPFSLPHHEHFPHLLHNVTLCLEEFSPPLCDFRGQQLDIVTTSTVGWPTRHPRGRRSLHATECDAPHICRICGSLLDRRLEWVTTHILGTSTGMLTRLRDGLASNFADLAEL